MRREKRVIVFEEEKYDGDWPPDDAAGYIAWFVEKLNSIPEEYRANATIEIGSRRSYEDISFATLEIYYTRPETDSEMAARKAEERRRQEAAKAEELRTLAALKAKYGV